MAAQRRLSAADAARLKAALRARLPDDADGAIAYAARATAARGTVAG